MNNKMLGATYSSREKSLAQQTFFLLRGCYFHLILRDIDVSVGAIYRNIDPSQASCIGLPVAHQPHRQGQSLAQQTPVVNEARRIKILSNMRMLSTPKHERHCHCRRRYSHFQQPGSANKPATIPINDAIYIAYYRELQRISYGSPTILLPAVATQNCALLRQTLPDATCNLGSLLVASVCTARNGLRPPNPNSVLSLL
jgi:hypothetical protein